MRAAASLLAFVACVAALTMNPLEDATSTGTVTVSWDASSDDPSSFSIYLTNEAFHNTFAIANNVDPSWGEITVQLPVIPVGDGYTVIATNIGNIDDVYATSGGFSVAEPSSTSASMMSTTSGVSSGASTGITVTSAPSQTSSFGHTNSGSSSSTRPSSSGTATSSSESSTGSAFNGNGAAGLHSSNGLVAAFVAAVAAFPFL
ncbi:hypothetical protein BD626DRAFT_261931 [Schizophyllum amplum]|uniref:Yeast cell wall synthesis Kre9/Knh1-like N-terminal domain-containing protein n=1 Tax=Schizophyllum amplum TaxID=97359 RepID=A0A550CGD6_9AGAR|nr:hypothetical protein BD626DRAFT_261931 [Auriculariopsis ampla]